MKNDQQIDRALIAKPSNDPSRQVDSMDLFAEELPDHADFREASTLACFSTGACSCVFSTAGTLTTVACN